MSDEFQLEFVPPIDGPRRATVWPCAILKSRCPGLTVGEPTQGRQSLPREATWNAYSDRETDEADVSVSRDGTVFVLETTIGREV